MKAISFRPTKEVAEILKLIEGGSKTDLINQAIVEYYEAHKDN